MKYRIKFECTNKELFNSIFKSMDDQIKALGIVPKIDYKDSKSSLAVKYKVPLDNRKKLDDLKE